VYGKDLKNFMYLLSKLKSIAIRFSEMNELDIKETSREYDDFISDLLNAPIFKNVNILDLEREFSFYELLKSAEISKNGRN
tara:strand:+ start:365 stop:607 length:243 start_codon:yes stop_codon:yes gene_type:complete